MPHFHVQGISESGKSSFLARLFLSLYDAGIPTSLIDPHGDLARLVLSHLVAKGAYSHRDALERIIYLDLPQAEDQGLYLPFNLLQQHLTPHTIANNFKNALHRAFPELAIGAASFDTLLPRAVRVLIQNNRTLVDLESFFTDPRFRNDLLAEFDDRVVVSFFHNVYEQMRTTDQLTYAGSVMRRAAQLTELPVLRHAFSQQDNLLNFRQIIDEGHFVIINLRLREDDASRLLGCLITVGLEQAAIARGEDRESLRTPHYMIVDEFASFVAQSSVTFSNILSQTRKFGLFGVFANQHWQQVPLELQGALSNARIKIMFQQDRGDAEQTAKLLGQPDLLHVKNDPETGILQYFPLIEEWEPWAQAIQNLPPRYFFLRQYPKPRSWFTQSLLGWYLGKQKLQVSLLKSLPTPEITIPEDVLTRIERAYLRRYFKPPSGTVSIPNRPRKSRFA